MHFYATGVPLDQKKKSRNGVIKYMKTNFIHCKIMLKLKVLTHKVTFCKASGAWFALPRLYTKINVLQPQDKLLCYKSSKWRLKTEMIEWVTQASFCSGHSIFPVFRLLQKAPLPNIFSMPRFTSSPRQKLSTYGLFCLSLYDKLPSFNNCLLLISCIYKRIF